MATLAPGSSVNSRTYVSRLAKAVVQDSDFWSHDGGGSIPGFSTFESADHAGFPQRADPPIGIALVL